MNCELSIKRYQTITRGIITIAITPKTLTPPAQPNPTLSKKTPSPHPPSITKSISNAHIPSTIFKLHKHFITPPHHLQPSNGLFPKPTPPRKKPLIAMPTTLRSRTRHSFPFLPIPFFHPCRCCCCCCSGARVLSGIGGAEGVAGEGEGPD